MNACLASTSFSPTEKLCQIQLAFDEINRVCCYPLYQCSRVCLFSV